MSKKPVLPTPHGEKMFALKANTKMPSSDLHRVQQAILRYQQWREESLFVNGTRQQIVSSLVKKLNKYKRYIELELIYDSQNDWLYRQKGQTKIDSSILEEFLPMLVFAVFQTELIGNFYNLGPAKCFSNLRFKSTFSEQNKGAGAIVKSKNQDFAIFRPVFIQTSHFSDFQHAITNQSNLAYVVAECKTNLDKTMFQEALATAQDLKKAIPGAKYFLLCEWLDMTLISTSITSIDEIIILRKAKRLPSNIRKHFSKAVQRKAQRQFFADYLEQNMFAESSFFRFLDHIQAVLNIHQLTAAKALKQGYF